MHFTFFMYKNNYSHNGNLVRAAKTVEASQTKPFTMCTELKLKLD